MAAVPYGDTSELQDECLTEDLNRNFGRLKAVFSFPQNNALIPRQLFIPFLGRQGMIFYIEGAVDNKAVEEHIIVPLLADCPAERRNGAGASELIRHILTTRTGFELRVMADVVRDLLKGHTILLIEGEPIAISVVTPGFEHRTVGEPQVEHVLKGPKEAFIESVAANRSLIRRQLRDHNLMGETVLVGSRATNEVTVMYIKNIADPKLVEEVKCRIQSIESDYVQNLSILEQHIEDRPYSLVPTTLMTERPDRTCAFLMEGHIILLMDNAPYALIVPVTFWSLFHTAEDQFQRWAYGNFVRIIRIMSIFVALLMPSLYIAVSTFHEEMLQTDLLLAIAATRERVPFPAFVEVLIMEISFELVREAGVRIPSVIGPTVGIVGALILGNAAVDANIISPILVIIVAITGLASFAIPEISFNFGVRILRFFLLISATFMGFYGISLFLGVFIAYLVSIKSFGVPFLSPMAPHYRSSKDMIVRPPVWKQWLRPFYTKPQIKQRMKKPEGRTNQ